MWNEETKNSESEFKKLYMNNKNKKILFKEDLKEKCKQAYATNENAKPIIYPKEEVFKFCSIKGSK